MSKGYEGFFKNAKKAKSGAAKNSMADEALRVALKMTKKKPQAKFSVPWLPASIVIVALALTASGFVYVDQIATFISRIELGALSSAFAEEKSSPPKGETSAKTSTETKGEPVAACADPTKWNDEEFNYLKKLNARKKELDLREAELNSLEEELHKQKAEIEARVQKLENVRGEIALVLKDRVELDEERIKTLVDFYSNMKPKQAAEVFGNLNEDLAVEILGRMKKKSAADIMNLLEPKKARVLSEKFTGYKTR